MPSSNPITPRADAPAGPATFRAFALPGLVNGFCGRTGGVGTGPFATFNLAEWIGDDAAAVAENWRRWNARYPGLPVARLSQVHGNRIHRIESVQMASADERRRRQGDGMVTATAGLLLGIFTADCVPILMVDAERRIAAALHAGWRGTMAGIAPAGVHAMVALGARRASIRTALGPSIGICCFEIDEALAEEFARRIPGAAARTRAGRSGKAYLDLRAIIGDQLEREGLAPESVVTTGPCTRCANDAYFSRRGAGGGTSGLQMSFIGFAE